MLGAMHNPLVADRNAWLDVVLSSADLDPGVRRRRAVLHPSDRAGALRLRWGTAEPKDSAQRSACEPQDGGGPDLWPPRDRAAPGLALAAARQAGVGALPQNPRAGLHERHPTRPSQPHGWPREGRSLMRDAVTRQAEDGEQSEAITTEVPFRRRGTGEAVGRELGGCR